MLATARVSQGKVTGQKITKDFRDWPPCGMVKDSQVFEMPAPLHSHFRPPLPFVLHGELYRPPPNYKGKNKLVPLKAKTIRDYFATPRV